MKTILVIEDERAIAEMLSLTLEEEGYRVLLAKNGREGLKQLAVELPDLVLSDMMMPLLDGRGLLATMRANPSYQSIPVILMSAALLGDKNLDGATFMPKPLDIGLLLHTIARLTQT